MLMNILKDLLLIFAILMMTGLIMIVVYVIWMTMRTIAYGEYYAEEDEDNGEL